MKRQTKESKKITIPAVAALLLSVKNTIIQYQARLFPFARAFFGFCLAGLLLVSCASGQKRTGNLWNANIDSGRLTSFGVSAIDGQDIWTYYERKSKEYGYYIPQGQRDVQVLTSWSNGFKDSTHLSLDVKEGSKYAIYAYELREGQNPNASIALLKECQDYGRGKIGTFFKENAGAFLFIAGVSYPPLGLAIVTVGAIAGTIQENRSKYSSQPNKANTFSQDATASTEDHQSDTSVDSTAQPPDYTEAQVPDPTSAPESKPEDTATATLSQPVEPPPAPTARPFDGCCYVWIEDADTNEVVAGTRLPGAAR